MDINTVVDYLQCCEYREEMTQAFEDKLKEWGYVVVTGRSDDLVMFMGAIREEYGAGKIYLDETGPIENKCVEECPYFKRLPKPYYIEPIWQSHKSPCWLFKTNIPHQTFDVVETYGDEWDWYAEAIIFRMEDLRPE